MITLRILLLAFIIPVQAHACLWTSGTTIHGGRVTVGWDMIVASLKDSLHETPAEHLESLSRNGSLEPGMDFPPKEVVGVKEVLRGNYDLAISSFKEVEAESPGRYSTAANLGTAYELQGNLDQALKWITEGIRRNPQSHDGTEWLHVEIIKARMKLKEEPGYLRHHHIIDLPEAVSKKSEIWVGGIKYTSEQVEKALLYQLVERMVFVKPQDPVVADLLFTFGELEGRTYIVESGLKLLRMAGDYGFQDGDLLTRRIGQYEWLIRFRMIWQFVGIPAVILLFLMFAYRKKWFFLTRKAHQEHLAKKHLRDR